LLQLHDFNSTNSWTAHLESTYRYYQMPNVAAVNS
jgi:hypothetical protein